MFVLSDEEREKLESAVQRNGGTFADIKYLSTGENFRAVMQLRTGKVKLVEVNLENEVSECLTTGTHTDVVADEDGNFHFFVTSNGRTQEQWRKHYEHHDSQMSAWAHEVLRYANEAPTDGVPYHVVIRPGKLTSFSDRTLNKMRAFAGECGWVKPHWEVICLMWDALTVREMKKLGLHYIVSMHEPIKCSNSSLWLLYLSLGVTGINLCAHSGSPDISWLENVGFVSLVPGSRSLDIFRT